MEASGDQHEEHEDGERFALGWIVSKGRAPVGREIAPR